MFLSNNSKYLKTNLILKIKNVNQWILISVAIFIALLVNFPRFISLYGLSDMINEQFTPVSEIDIFVRCFFLITFSWLILQFNTNWKNKYLHYSFLSRTTITIIVNVLISIISVKSLYIIYPVIVGKAVSEPEKYVFYFAYLIVFLIVYFVSRVLRYQIINQQQIVENEHLKQENLENELVALKNQVNPHFLFNSLNSLNSLIRDNKKATKFVNKLSFMYRYILQSGDRNLVSLEEELKFLESYIFLIQTRYRNRFEIEIDIDMQFLEKKVPPLSLQLLVENAVKHNEISETNPLLVKVYSEDGYICVENKIKLRATFVDNTGNGLSNLNKRYLLLKDHQILISDANNIFKVKFLLEN